MKMFCNFHILLIINIIMICSQNRNNLINAQQHIQCITSDNEDGICIGLSECPSLDTLYKDNPVKTREMIAFFIKSHTICGKRNVDRQPILCCPQQTISDNSITKITIKFTTSTSSIPETTTAVNDNRGKFINVIKDNKQSTTCKILKKENDNHSGICTEIKKCSHIFQLYLTNSEDQNLIDFLLYGQRICDNKIINGNPVICCPEESDLSLIFTKETNLPESITTTASSSSTTLGTDVDSQQTKLESQLLTPEENCGFSNASHTKIVGGQPAELGAWPWMALLGYADRLDEIEWKCGGSIITTKHVLTAAHCIINSLKIVRLGEHDIELKTDTNTIDIPILKSQKHFKYSVRDGHNDIAIVYLKYPIKFTSNIKPICLPINEPLRSTVFTGYQPFIAGWGRTQEGGKTANVLQELQIPILRNVDCQERYQRIGKLISGQQFDDAVLCAGILTGGKDSCQGDSGGPLMIASLYTNQKKTIYYQIGIVSYGIGCARADIPGVYTKVQHFIDWIEQQIENN